MIKDPHPESYFEYNVLTPTPNSGDILHMCIILHKDYFRLVCEDFWTFRKKLAFPELLFFDLNKRIEARHIQVLDRQMRD